LVGINFNNRCNAAQQGLLRTGHGAPRPFLAMSKMFDIRRRGGVKDV
jgi:hypothetical protein